MCVMVCMVGGGGVVVRGSVGGQAAAKGLNPPLPNRSSPRLPRAPPPNPPSSLPNCLEFRVLLLMA